MLLMSEVPWYPLRINERLRVTTPCEDCIKTISEVCMTDLCSRSRRARPDTVLTPRISSVNKRVVCCVPLRVACHLRGE